MEVDNVIQILYSNSQLYKQIQEFSKSPGIYAIFFVGAEFPISGVSLSPNEIIYIGKTEDSQEKRDANTHFATGKTGGSTVRATIGAFLREKYNLNPIPRNDTDHLSSKTRHFYKFDYRSERIITCWMRSNLALSFFEYDETNRKIEVAKYLLDLETQLIEKLIPIFNLQKNQKNLYRKYIGRLRKMCADIAMKKAPVTDLGLKQCSRKEKYLEVWQSNINRIEEMLLNEGNTGLELKSMDFQNVGHRKTYSFNLEYENGSRTKITNSAVARDLDTVLNHSESIKSILSNGSYSIKMNNKFCANHKKAQG